LLFQQLARDRGQATLRVTHGRRRIAIERTEVALPIDQRHAQAVRLRQTYQCVVDGGVTVRVVVAHHVAHHLGALLVLAVGQQALLPHGEQDAPLHRLEAVAHVRQRTTGDDRQRVV
jgi:hypothetical protein